MTRITDRVMRDHMRHWKIWTRNRRRAVNSGNNSGYKVHAVTKSHNAIGNKQKWPTRRLNGMNAVDDDIKYLLLRGIAALVKKSLSTC